MKGRTRILIAIVCGVVAAGCLGLFLWGQAQASARARSAYASTEPQAEETAPEAATVFDSLAPGMCAVTLSTDAVHALGGELKRGMNVTLMAVLPDGTVAVLAEGIEVLSANAGVVAATDVAEEEEQSGGLLGGSAGSGESINWVTVAVPQGQVTQILAAANANTVHLVLPNDEEDGTEVGLEGEDEVSEETSMTEEGN
jgi:hypothetical protein